MTSSRPEPSFIRAVVKALGDARTVLDLGPGALGSATPERLETTAIEDEPRTLGFDAGAFDAATAVFSVQHWGDVEHGLTEVRRVTRGPIVLLTRDPDRIADSWLAEYAPELVAADAGRYPALSRITEALHGETVTCTTLPVPFTSVTGFAEGYYARPERLLDAQVRAADDAWELVDEMTGRRSVAALRAALASGEWDRAHGALRTRPTLDGSVVLVTATPVA